jgi:hypothetical protein
MGRIIWEYQSAALGWLGKVGTRSAFLATPNSSDWSLKFIWTGAMHTCGNVTKSRAIAEKVLAEFAEQTGLALPEEHEEENTLAQELVERLRSEVRWFKDGETDEQRAGYVATQALMVFGEFLKAQLKSLEQMGKDPEYYRALNLLDTMIDIVQQAQEDLGVEVEREVN